MLTIGITGGSGAGKSTVSEIIASFGGEAIDADRVYARLLNDSDAMLKELGRRFPDALLPDGRLSRRHLAEIVFSDKESLSDLNKIAHKFVIEETEKRMAELYQRNVPHITLDAIALIESGLSKICDFTIGVIAPRAVRLQRICARDNIDSMAASARINAQQPDEFYMENCDFIIVNDGEIDAVYEKTKEVFNLITKGSAE